MNTPKIGRRESMIGLAALLAGCAALKEADTLTFEDLRAMRSSHLKATKTAELSRSGLATVLSNYERMQKEGIAADADEAVKGLYKTLTENHKELIEGAYKSAELFLYAGHKSDMGDRAHKDAPIGKGADRTFAGKWFIGKDGSAHDFSLDDMVTILRKSTAQVPVYSHDKEKRIPYEQVLGKGVFVKRELVTDLVKNSKTYGDVHVPLSYLDAGVLKNLTDGKESNGEIRGEPEHWVVHAVYNGHKIK